MFEELSSSKSNTSILSSSEESFDFTEEQVQKGVSPHFAEPDNPPSERQIDIIKVVEEKK